MRTAIPYTISILLLSFSNTYANPTGKELENLFDFSGQNPNKYFESYPCTYDTFDDAVDGSSNTDTSAPSSSSPEPKNWDWEAAFQGLDPTLDPETEFDFYAFLENISADQPQFSASQPLELPAGTSKINLSGRKRWHSETETYSQENDYLSKAVCWRICPNMPGYLQLLDENNAHIYVSKILPRNEKPRQLYYGYLRLQIEGKIYQLPRDPHDSNVLSEHGFCDIHANQIVTYKRNKAHKPRSVSAATKKRKTLANIYQKTAYWMINPDIPGYFLLLDKEGNPLHTTSVKIKGNTRKLSHGLLRLQAGPIVKKIPRHPEDHANITDHGFEPGQKTKTEVKNMKFPSILTRDPEQLAPKATLGISHLLCTETLK